MRIFVPRTWPEYPLYKTFFKENVKTSKETFIFPPIIQPKHLEYFEDENICKILLITEPIKNFSKSGENFHLTYKLFLNNKFDIIVGCINHDIENRRFKFPIYLFQWNFNYKSDKLYLSTNKYVQESIDNKKFCCLINGWDPDGHRTKMYNKLSSLGNIFCPGKLLNNCPTFPRGNNTKPKYIRNFWFNICSENYDHNNIEGYITEKLMDACLGGAIPIYAGWFDEYDAKIFNKDRILFYNSKDELSFEKVYKQIKELLENKEKLISFYRQPVFCETAFETIQKLRNDFVSFSTS